MSTFPAPNFGAALRVLPEAAYMALRRGGVRAVRKARLTATAQKLVGTKRPKDPDNPNALTLVKGITARVSRQKLLLTVGNRTPYGTIYNRGGNITQDRNGKQVSWHVEARPYANEALMLPELAGLEEEMIRAAEAALFTRL